MTSKTDSLMMTREELIEQLEARRPWAVRLDARRLKAHQVAEREALKTFRASLREALTWDYKKAKAEYFQPNIRTSGPTCPRSVVAVLETAITRAKADRRIRVTIPPEREPSTFWLLTHDENAPAGGLC